MDEALAAWRQHLELKRLLADIRLDLLRLEYLRKYRPDQPRNELGRWTRDGGEATDLSSAKRVPPIVKEFGDWGHDNSFRGIVLHGSIASFLENSKTPQLPRSIGAPKRATPALEDV